MSKARELNARLFLEGRSVPFVGANMTFTKGQPSVSTIKMPPLPEAKRIKPRTMAHIFVKDFTFPGSEKPWVLLFEGEVYGHSKGKSTNSRTFNLYAMGLSNYWDNAKQYYMNARSSFGDSNNVYNSQKAIDQAERDNQSVEYTASGITAYVTTLINKVLDDPNKDLVDGIIEVVKKVEDVNPFFRYNQHRYRLNDRIIFESSGALNDLFSFNNKEALWNAISGRGNSGTVTVRQLVNLILGMVFHDFTTVAAPSKINSDLKDGVGEKRKQTIGSFVFKPETFMMPPPKCNVLFPDHYGQLGVNRNFFHEVTRYKNNVNMLSGIIRGNFPRSVAKTFYTPKGFNQFRTGEDFLETDYEQFKSPIDQGKHNEEAPEDERSTTFLRDYNFLSHEELMKGIFTEMGTAMPSSHIFSLIVPKEDQQSFFQQATDYLFHKKRLASRGSRTQGALNLSPVVGFAALLLDDSDAEQNMIGTLESLSHNISAEGGGSTQYTFSFLRDVDEEDLWSGDSYEPPIPPWYDPSVFGRRRALEEKDYENLSEENQEKVKRFKGLTGFEDTTLRQYYLGLLGNTEQGSHLGAEPIVTNKFPNVYAATLNIIEKYREAKTKGEEKNFVNVQTRRDYVFLDETFRFLGAELTPRQTNVNFDNSRDIVFRGDVFDGDFVDKANDSETARDSELKDFFRTDLTQKRRDPIDAYRSRLFTERGFRG